MLRRELLSVCQAYAESHGNIFNYSKTVCMTFKAECKKQSLHYTWVGGKNLKSVNQYKYLGAVLDTELPDDKAFRDNCDKNIVQKTSCESLLMMLKCS